MTYITSSIFYSMTFITSCIFYYHKEYILGSWSCTQGYKGMIQEEILKLIANFKYFKAIFVLCFHSPTPSLPHVSAVSAFWLRPTPKTR